MTPFEQALKNYAEAYQRFVKDSNDELKIQKKVIASRKNLLLAREELREVERESLNY